MSFPSPSLARTAWLVVVLLMPVALLNYLDRQLLAVMRTSVMASIPDIETKANWGIMLGQFKWVYAFLSPLGGYIADRFSRRYTIFGSLFVWSAVTWWTGQVTTYQELLWARSLMGFSEAFYFPAALALIADYHTGSTRSRAVGLHQMGIYFGVVVGAFGGYLADKPDLGWRLAFDVCGVLGMVYAVPLVLLLRDPPRMAVVAARPSPLDAGRTLFGNRSFVLLVLYFTLPAMAGWIFRDWMPSVLKERFGLEQGPAGVAAILSYQIPAILAALLGGWLADRWMQHDIRGRIFVSAIGMLIIVPAVFGVGNAVSLTMAVAFLILFGVGWAFFDCNNMPILCQIVRPEYRATGYGVMNMVSISCGGLADWGFGAMQDRGLPLNLIFGVFAGLALLSVALVLAIRPRRETE